MDERLRKNINQLKLDINSAGCQLGGLEVKRSYARPKALGFESHVRDRECTPLQSPRLGRNGFPVLPSFHSSSSLGRLINSAVKFLL